MDPVRGQAAGEERQVPGDHHAPGRVPDEQLPVERRVLGDERGQPQPHRPASFASLIGRASSHGSAIRCSSVGSPVQIRVPYFRR